MLKNLVWRVRIAFSEILMPPSRSADRVAELVVVLLAEIDAFLGRGDEDGEGAGGGLGNPVGPRPGRPPAAPAWVAGGLRRVQTAVVMFFVLVLTAMLIVVTYISPTRSPLRKVLARVLGRRLKLAALVLSEYRDICSDDDGHEGMGGGGLATPAGPRPGRPPAAPSWVAAWLRVHVNVLPSGFLLAPVESLLRKALAQLRAPSIVMHKHEHGTQVLAPADVNRPKGTVVALAAHSRRTTSSARQDRPMMPVLSDDVLRTGRGDRDALGRAA